MRPLTTAQVAALALAHREVAAGYRRALAVAGLLADEREWLANRLQAAVQSTRELDGAVVARHRHDGQITA